MGKKISFSSPSSDSGTGRACTGTRPELLWTRKILNAPPWVVYLLILVFCTICWYLVGVLFYHVIVFSKNSSPLLHATPAEPHPQSPVQGDSIASGSAEFGLSAAIINGLAIKRPYSPSAKARMDLSPLSAPLLQNQKANIYPPGSKRQKAESLRNEKLLLAIERVESNGRTNATGDNGRAVGCLQIHKRMVNDVNRILRRRAYFYNDRLNRQKSFAMANVYLTHYGRGLTIEQKARIWNGGPVGHKKQATLAYAKKVMRTK